jgi:mannose-6-phosphate isomerase-like protein (cupin superfamily)
MQHPVKLVFLCALAAVALFGRESLAGRIAHTDPAKYRHAPSVHKGAGSLDFMSMLGSDSLNTNLFFLHRGVIQPKSGIGHHFHNQCEEMFVIFDGEAEFTIDGRTSLLKGPAGALCRMGHSHAIYNPTDKPVQWMNINVSNVKGKYDAFDLGDSRAGVALDAVPVFMTMRLDKALLRPVDSDLGIRRRALSPDVFGTNWSWVDHIVVKPGARSGKERHEGVEEVYYVMNGQGIARINDESCPIRQGDAIPVAFNEVHSFDNNASADLEFLVIGIARSRFVLDTVPVP